MVNWRITLVVVVMIVGVGVLMTSALSNTAKAVVTVNELVQQRSERQNIRLGARVANKDINYQTTPEFLLQFTVHDIGKSDKQIAVKYQGMMPDTFQAGRDVILDGHFDGNTFVANSLLTQCPSKYEAPSPE